MHAGVGPLFFPFSNPGWHYSIGRSRRPLKKKVNNPLLLHCQARFLAPKPPKTIEWEKRLAVVSVAKTG